MTSLQEAYNIARTKKSDINQHVPTLRRLAEQCNHVTEFGVRLGVSTTAILSGSIHGKLKLLVSFDWQEFTLESEFKKMAPDKFVFVQKDTRFVVVAKTDMLFVDTRHTYKQLKKELTLNHKRVRRWIVLHDTKLFGRRNEAPKDNNDGKILGLIPAIKEFLSENPEWFISEHYKYNSGLTVLSKDHRDYYGGSYASF